MRPDRGYSIHIETDLFGGFWVLRRWWGRHNRRGGAKRHQLATLRDCITLINTVAKTRQRHGYACVDWPATSATRPVDAMVPRKTVLVTSADLRKTPPKTKAASGGLVNAQQRLAV